GELLQVAAALAVGLRVDAVVAEFQRGAHGLVPLVDRAYAEGEPFLAGVVVEIAVLVDLHVHHLDVVGQADHALVDQTEHLAVAVAGAVAPAAADDAVGAVLQGELVVAAEPIALGVLEGDQVTFLVSVAGVAFLLVGEVGLAVVVADFQLAVGVDVDLGQTDVEGVVGDVGAGTRTLVDVIAVGIADPGDAGLGEAQIDVLDAGAGTGYVPVVVIVDVNIVALVVALAGPDVGARQTLDQVVADHVELAYGHVATFV